MLGNSIVTKKPKASLWSDILHGNRHMLWKRIIRFKTWNTQRCTGKLEEIVKEIEQHRIDILTPTETKKMYQRFFCETEWTNRKTNISIGDLKNRTRKWLNCNMVGLFIETVKNNNNDRLIEIYDENNLKITNSFHNHKDIHKYTGVQHTRNPTLQFKM